MAERDRLKRKDVEDQASRAAKIGPLAYLLVAAAAAAPAVVVTIQKLAAGQGGPMMPPAQLMLLRFVFLVATAALFGNAWFQSSYVVPVGIRRRLDPMTSPTNREDVLTFCYTMTLLLWISFAFPVIFSAGLTVLGRSLVDLAMFGVLSVIMAVVFHPTTGTWVHWLEIADVEIVDALGS